MSALPLLSPDCQQCLDCLNCHTIKGISNRKHLSQIITLNLVDQAIISKFCSSYCCCGCCFDVVVVVVVCVVVIIFLGLVVIVIVGPRNLTLNFGQNGVSIS